MSFLFQKYNAEQITHMLKKKKFKKKTNCGEDVLSKHYFKSVQHSLSFLKGVKTLTKDRIPI